MAGPFASLVKGKYDKEAAKRAGELAEKQQKAGMQLVNELDYEPMYASERVPTFQRSQSPVARSYLESFLAGNNPSATFSGAPNAKVTKMRQQGAQDQMFGTMQQRIAAQRAMEAETPWKVTPPERKINPNRNATPGGAQWTVENGKLAGYGINKEINDAVSSTGNDLTLGYQKGTNPFGRDGMLAREGRAAGIQNLLQNEYRGDEARLAADIRAAGGIEQLFAQYEAQDRQKKKGR